MVVYFLGFFRNPQLYGPRGSGYSCNLIGYVVKKLMDSLRKKKDQYLNFWRICLLTYEFKLPRIYLEILNFHSTRLEINMFPS